MSRSQIKAIVAIVNTAMLAGVASLASAADPKNMPTTVVSPRQEYTSMGHEFQLETGEKLLLSHRHKVTSYRVCVDTFKNAVPLKVFVDGTESTVGVAACETISGKHVSVEPGGKLPPGEYLVARFQRMKD